MVLYTTLSIKNGTTIYLHAKFIIVLLFKQFFEMVLNDIKWYLMVMEY